MPTAETTGADKTTDRSRGKASGLPKSDIPSNDVDKQILQLREDVNDLTYLIKQLAAKSARDAGDITKTGIEDFLNLTNAMAESAKSDMKTRTDRFEGYVEQNPVRTTFIALVTGFLVGWLSRR